MSRNIRGYKNCKKDSIKVWFINNGTERNEGEIIERVNANNGRYKNRDIKKERVVEKMALPFRVGTVITILQKPFWDRMKYKRNILLLKSQY